MANHRLARKLAAVVGVVAVAGATIGVASVTEHPQRVVATRLAAATTATPAILHLVVATRSSAAPNVKGSLRRAEIWAAGSPARWHTRELASADPHHAMLLSDGRFVPSVGVIEGAYRAGRSELYFSHYKDLRVRTGIPATFPTARAGVFLALRSNDPAATFRREFIDGVLRDGGVSATSAGRQVRHLTRTTQAKKTLTQIVIYDVDAATFEPLSGSLTMTRVRPARPQTTVETFTVERYERLPDTKANAALLRIPVAADARIDKRRAMLPH